MADSDLLEKYVELYNLGAENGDYAPMMELFDDDAVYEFEDPCIGIFRGKDQIGRMFRLQIPEFNLTIFNIRETMSAASADYADNIAPMTRLGGILLQSNSGKIKRIVIKR
jgi:hypothetical protein